MKESGFITPANGSLRDILFSACPSFRLSVNILRFLLYNLRSFGPILFTPEPSDNTCVIGKNRLKDQYCKSYATL